MKTDAKTTFAQSSDIKSRTYLEYRRDMKKKAIAEFETIEWFSKKINAKVVKSGGDAHIWFLRKGGITGDSDFEAERNGKIEKFEFQYSDIADLDFFDFKVSKVGKKIKNKRVPYNDKKFIYILKPTLQYGIIEPEWIMNNGKEAGVPAWGNRTAYRVPKEKFKEILNTDKSLEMCVKNINNKIKLLNFQFDFLKQESEKLSILLQNVIDKDKFVKIMPKNLDDFYKICFILDKLNEIPNNADLWLIYILSLLNDKLNSYQMVQLVYCVDFLYSKIDLQKNELEKVIEAIKLIKDYCIKNQNNNGKFETSDSLSPKEELRNFLFIVNLLEDLIQDCIFYYDVKFKSVEKIFENVKYIDKTLDIIDKST